MMPLTASEGSRKSIPPQFEPDNGIYEPLDISDDELHEKHPYSREFIQTRVVKLKPELSALGLIQCSLHTSCIFVDTLYGDHRTDKAEQDKNESFRSNTMVAIEKQKAKYDCKFEDYTALSYVWGPDCDHKMIEVNAKLFPVRSNLWHFLNHARINLPWLSNIWIDALCINQADIDERNYQVKCMGGVYAEASQVLVWLGNGLEVYDSMLDIAQEYSNRALHPVHADSDTDVIHDACQKRGVTPQEFSATLDKFLNLEYWVRAWVIQEFFLARSLLIMSASRTIPYEVLVRALAVASYHRDDSLVEDSVRQTSLYTYIMFITDRETFLSRNNDRTRDFRLYRGRAPVQFANAKSSKCSDPKDRIYSQLSLVFKGWEFPLDYREDEYTLFLRTLLFCFGSQKIEEVLFLSFWNFVQALELGPEPLTMMLLSRTQESEQHRRLLTEYKQQFVLYKAVVHDWHVSQDGNMKCPDCGKYITPGNGAEAFDRFCCLRVKQAPPFFWECHISFPSLTKGHISDEWLVAHFSRMKCLLRQSVRVDAERGVRLNLWTCLQLWDDHVQDMLDPVDYDDPR